MRVTGRIPSFGVIGAAKHRSDFTAIYWVHTAVLKVLFSSSPSDAYWLLRTRDRLSRPCDVIREQTPLLGSRNGQHQQVRTLDRSVDGAPVRHRRNRHNLWKPSSVP